MVVSEQDVFVAAEGTDIERAAVTVQAGPFLIEMGELMAQIAFIASSWVGCAGCFSHQTHFVIITAARQSQIELFLRLALPHLDAEAFQCLIGLFAVVADEAKEGLLALEDGHLGEGHDVITFVDALVDQVPDVDVLVDLPHERVCEEVVQQRFGRHELVGIHEYHHYSLLTLQHLLQLPHALKIFHLL